MSYGIGCVDVPLPRVLWTGQVQLKRNITLAMQMDRAIGVLGQLLIRGFPHVRVVPVDLLLSIPTRLLSLTLAYLEMQQTSLLRVWIKKMEKPLMMS
jgi:hypothetical protein